MLDLLGLGIFQPQTEQVKTVSEDLTATGIVVLLFLHVLVMALD